MRRVLINIWLVAASSLFAVIDRDNNGLSDVYELAYFNAAADPFADRDGDGVSNYDEMVWGTNPTNAASKVTGPTATLGGTNLSLTWPFTSHREYELQASEDLLTWQTVASGAISSHVEHLATTPARKFFRLKVSLDTTDSNGNGLADWEESLYEQAFGHPLDSTTDTDGDGLPDQEEFRQQRQPWKKDHPAVGLILFTPLEK